MDVESKLLLLFSDSHSGIEFEKSRADSTSLVSWIRASAGKKVQAITPCEIFTLSPSLSSK